MQNKSGFLPGLTRARWIFLKEMNSFPGANLPPISTGLVAFLCGLVSVLLALSPGATYEDVTRAIFYFFYIIVIASSLILSMSAFVNERKQGTLELLYTLPVSDLELVLGKFLMGGVILSVVSIAITLVYAVLIAEAPWYMAATGIVGLILVGIYGFSVGLFASSLTESYLLSLLISGVIVLFVDVGGYLSGLLPSPAREIFAHMHGINEFTPFTRGVIPLKGTIFFMSLTILFLFLTVKVLESRRWRGDA